MSWQGKNPKDVLKELDKQEDENYGDHTISGSNPDPESDDDVEAIMSDAVGDDFEEEEDLDIAGEVDGDEAHIGQKQIEDETPESELEKVEKKEDLLDDDFAQDDEGQDEE